MPYDDAIDPEAVSDMLEARPDIRILSVCHLDTPSGTVNPVREIGAICRGRDVLTIVDAVSSFGGMDVHPEDMNADIFVTSPSKCLGGSTGLCIVHVSERAWAKIDANPAAPTGSVLSLKDWRDAWRSPTCCSRSRPRSPRSMGWTPPYRTTSTRGRRGCGRAMR